MALPRGPDTPGMPLPAVAGRAAAERGARALELNVFGTDRTAIALYESSGHRVTAQRMRGDLVR